MTASPRLEGSAGPAPEAIRDYMHHLLGAAGFKASPRRRKLLEYVVEQTLLGRAGRLKAFDLAVAVLGRDERFDPQADPIVRIEVGRLRRDLDHYYEGDGAADAIRVSIPKGHYVPTFVFGPASPVATDPTAPPAPAGAVPRNLGIPLALATLAVLLLAAGVWLLASWYGRGQQGRQIQAAGPAVLVMPFESLAGGDGGQLLASGITGGLIAGLMRSEGLQVFSLPASGQGSAALPQAASGAPAYVVTGSVERASARVRVMARLAERASGEVLWSQDYARELSTAEIFDVQSEVTTAIVGRLAQRYGVINTDATKRLRQNPPETLFAYECVQRAFAYRRIFARELYPPVRSCLLEAVRRDPGYAAAWAMLAFAHMDAGRFGFVPGPERAAEMAAGLAAANRAMDLAPDNVTSLQALSALLYMTGDVVTAEKEQRQAIALNPHDPESLAQLGWRLTVSGRADEGARLLQEAVDRSVSPPRWYNALLGLAYLLSGDLARARGMAQAGKESCCGIGQFILALTEGAAGQTPPAQAALAEAMRQAPVLGSDPRAFLVNLGVAETVVEGLLSRLASINPGQPPPP